MTYDAVGDEGHQVGGDESLLIHSLVAIPPVLNCKNGLLVKPYHPNFSITYFPSKLAC